MNDIHHYEVDLQWVTATLGILSSPVIVGTIEVVTPPAFPNGIKDKWTPEHLFVAAVNSCLLSTFLIVAENSKLQFISFESHAIATFEKMDGKFSVTEIILKPTLCISSRNLENKAKHVLNLSEKACAIANSIKTTITLEPIITISE